MRSALRLKGTTLLPDSIADAIAEAIAVQAIKPGDAIIESTVAKDLGISRFPVREAMKVLRAQGLLDGGSHRSWRVVPFTADRIATVREIRICLETILLRDAIARWRASGPGLDIVEEALKVMRTAIRSGDMFATIMSDIEFHRSIGNAANNAMASTLWEAIARQIMIIFNIEGRAGVDPNDMVSEHEYYLEMIREAIASGADSTALRKEVELHVNPAAPAASRFVHREVQGV